VRRAAPAKSQSGVVDLEHNLLRLRLPKIATSCSCPAPVRGLSPPGRQQIGIRIAPAARHIDNAGRRRPTFLSDPRLPWSIDAVAPDPTEPRSCSRLLICLQINRQTIAGDVASRKTALTGGVPWWTSAGFSPTRAVRRQSQVGWKRELDR
jgi:hypothetical protein